jgi:hypothetical protein
LNKLIGQLLSKNKNGLTDSFIAWRLKGMVEEGKIEWQDDKNKGWKDIQVRRTAAKEITSTEQ